MNSGAMATAASVKRELIALGFETNPLTGREFYVPAHVAIDVAYRWLLLTPASCLRILRAAFPSEAAKLVEHWASCEDLNRMTGEVGERVKSAVRASICTTATAAKDARRIGPRPGFDARAHQEAYAAEMARYGLTVSVF